MTAGSAEPRPCSNLILVCGPPRSGTTWLTREVCNLPSAFPFLPECTFLTQQMDIFHRILHYSDGPRLLAYFGDHRSLRDYYRNNVSRLIRTISELHRTPQSDTLVLKDPGICHCLDVLDELLPPYKLIILVRDPRDVLASLKVVTARSKGKWDFKDTAYEIAKFYYQIDKHAERQAPHCLVVRYEDLLAGRVAALRSFLGFPILTEPCSPEAVGAVSRHVDSSDPFFSDLYLRPTTSERIGSFLTILSLGEIHWFQSRFRSILQRWRYDPVSFRVSAVRSLERAFRPRLPHQVLP